ncbi:MAG: amidohydrolase [Actinomycetota bacterium]|nr:amidohydrolase [Actinomycetota bacterium]
MATVADKATLVLRSGRVRTPSSPSGFAEAVAVEGDRIVAVGTDDEIAERTGPATRVIDLGGRLAIPAFGDAHIHAISAGVERMRCDLTGFKSRAEYLERIAAYAAGLPADAWVLGGGWSMEAFPGGVPVAADLDATAGGRPVFLPNRDHHSAWVSTAAMERAGLDASVADPPDGRVERDASGRPTGALHDGAMDFVQRVVPLATQAELAAGLRLAQAHLHSLGITHWQDAIVGDAGELGMRDTYTTYRQAAAEGWLTARVVGALWWRRDRGLEQITDLLSRREAASDGPFRARAVKMMLDGVCETFTAAMSRAYVGDAGSGGHRGSLFIDEEVVAAAVPALDEQGFQVHFHAIGDRAVTTALDALERIPVARRGAGRHHLAHLQFIAPPDLDRFAPLGAIANFQPLWACHEPQMDELTIPFVGEERSGWQYSIASLVRRNARVAFGSDWPVSSPDPIQEIHVAVNRMLSVRLGRPGRPETQDPFRPGEALSVTDAVDAFTAGVAYVNGDEELLGAVTPGRRADIAVLDQDLYTIPPGEIGDTSVALTVAGGAVVHGDA